MRQRWLPVPVTGTRSRTSSPATADCTSVSSDSCWKGAPSTRRSPPAPSRKPGSTPTANGAEVRTVTYDGFDLGERQWEYTVLTKQRDTVEGGTTSARSESRSRVAVRITAGMCGGGLIIGGDCRPWGLLQQLCDLELNPPEPTPSSEPEESEGPSDPPGPEPEPEEPELTPPPGLEGVGCLSGADLLGLLDPEIRLVT